MVGKCKDCGSEERVRNGVVHGKQRYKCKICGLNYREGDERVKYSDEKRIRVIKWYLEGAGIRSIDRYPRVEPVVLYASRLQLNFQLTWILESLMFYVASNSFFIYTNTTYEVAR